MLHQGGEELAAEFEGAGLAAVQDGPSGEDAPLLMPEGAHHHLGTTRMHREPAAGVVDEHCRVHGVSNLFIAGGSVFPTGGSANPTFTIAALAIRLADHLRETVAAGARPGRRPVTERRSVSQGSSLVEKSPRVSVLIATRERADPLAGCLPAVLANDYPDFEMIVIDQSSGDESRVVVEALGDVRVRYQRQHGAGLSRARNAAIEAARGELLAFTDDDRRVPPGWLRRIVEVFDRDRGAGLIFGAFVPRPHDPREVFVPGFTPTRYRRLSGRVATRLNRSEAGGNMAIRRAVLAVLTTHLRDG